MKTDNSYKLADFTPVVSLNNLLINIESERLKKTNLTQFQKQELIFSLSDNISQINDKKYLNYIYSIMKRICDETNERAWYKELKTFGKNHSDIAQILETENEGIREFIIIMDDSTKDSVLDYNDFGFTILRKYKKYLNDFMVLDKNTAVGVMHMYSQVQTIYMR